jgi:hypothetical protein
VKPTVWMAVFGASFSGLGFEVVLARAFAISQWNHLSFMVISIALFGFAASGSFLSVPKVLQAWTSGEAFSERTAVAGCVLLSASISIAWFGLIHTPLDYYRLLLESRQLVYLLAVYLLLILPFFFAGGVTAVAYVAYPQKPGSVYFASMTGSALGAIASAGLLPTTGETGVAGLTALAPLAVPLIRLIAPRGSQPEKLGGRTALPVLAVIGLFGLGSGIWMLTAQGDEGLNVRPSEYKFLSQVLQFPDTHVAESFSGIRGRIERVQSPHLRFAPGLSLKYGEAPPAVEAVFTDGDQPFFLYGLNSERALDFARFTLSYLGYEAAGRPPGSVLVIAGGGGLAIPCAMASGAGVIRIVHSNPQLAELIRRHYGLQVVRDSPRSHLARTGEIFDVIHVESWGASIPGADALHQEHLLTVESLVAYLEHLSPQGVLIISRKLLLPPAGVLRLWATARLALLKIGVPAPELCMAILRNWDTFTLMVTRQPLPNPALLLESSRRLNFDVVYLPDADEAAANRFNVYDAPYHFREIQRLQDAISQDRADDFFADYALDVAPQSDLRAFPGRFLKWTRIGDLYRTLGSRLHALFLAGEVIVGVVFVEALLASLLLLLLPAAVIVKKMHLAAPTGITYFLGIGSGFMFSELLFIHAGAFFLGDPVISLAVAITALLFSSGLGGIWAQRLRARAMRPALLAAGGSVALTAVGLGLFAGELSALPEGARYAALTLAVMIPGFAMGIPFPLGMRYLLSRPADRTFAWAVNGCASVLAAVVAAQMAISMGFGLILATALASYWIVALAGAGRSGGEAMADAHRRRML